MSELSPEVAAAVFMLACISAGFLIGWFVRPDDDEQAERMLRQADKKARRRIRLGRSWRNLFGLWSN